MTFSPDGRSAWQPCGKQRPEGYEARGEVDGGWLGCDDGRAVDGCLSGEAGRSSMGECVPAAGLAGL